MPSTSLAAAALPAYLNRHHIRRNCLTTTTRRQRAGDKWDNDREGDGDAREEGDAHALRLLCKPASLAVIDRDRRQSIPGLCSSSSSSCGLRGGPFGQALAVQARGVRPIGTYQHGHFCPNSPTKMVLSVMSRSKWPPQGDKER